MHSNYMIGNDVHLKTSVQDEAGAYYDPATLTLSIKKPDGTFENVINIGGLTHDGLGLFSYVYFPLTVGIYTYKFTVGGSRKGASELTFSVFASQIP